MSAKGKKGANDPTRFEGNGISYRAKLIGIEDVPEARGDQMCQETITKLKNSVKISGEHKRKIFVNVTVEGLKIIDAVSLASNPSKKKNEPKSPKSGGENEQPDKGQEIVLHTHPVHRISFISRDTTDNRAFGYIFGQEDGTHQFFAIKTAAAAEQLVLALRDLFQVVYEQKKKEMDDAKEKLEKGEIEATSDKENSQTSRDGSTSGTGQTRQEKASADAENIYQVPTNNAPVNPEAQAEQVANLLDLEDQADHILKGIEQIKNLEFDAMGSESASSSISSPPTSPVAKLAPPSAAAAAPTSNFDPWGLSGLSSAPAAQAPAPTPPTSALGDLAGLQTSPFPSMGQQPFPGSPFQMHGGFGGAQGYNMMGSGLPVTKDPFANDPFGAPGQQQQQQQQQQPGMPGAGGFGTANPFGGGFNQQFGMQGGQQPGMMFGMMPGMVPHGMVSQSPVRPGMNSPNPFGAAQTGRSSPQVTSPFGGEDDNVLKPVKKDGDQSAGSQDTSKKSPHADLFGDLVDIRRSASPTAKTPKDMFAQLSLSEKKSMNELKSGSAPPTAAAAPAAQASGFESDPFGERVSIEADRTRGLLLSDSGEEDPFDVSHIPPSLAESSNHNTQFVNSSTSSPATNPPPVPARHPSFTKTWDKSSSSHMPPLLPPPPAPSLSSSPHTPPLPSRTPSISKVIKDVNANSFSPPSNLPVSDTSPISSSFMLPSPDEPPPPLPLHLTLPSSSSIAPPPPPRPNLKSTPLPSPPVHQNGHREEKNKSLKNISTSHISGSSSLKQSVSQGAKQDNGHRSQVHDLTQMQSVSKTFDADSSASDISSDSNLHASSPSHTHLSDQSKHLETCDHKKVNDTTAQLKQEWVGFDQSDNDPFTFVPSTTNEDNDPFNMPVHLTPGFKAVAKFGNDPFDDSINSMLSNNTDAWDPFADHGGSVSSPFGDAFGAPPQPQPVNGSATNKPLLD